jgi:hypothetical protein
LLKRFHNQLIFTSPIMRTLSAIPTKTHRLFVQQL